MTENKRFTDTEVDEEYNLICMNDNYTGKFHSFSAKGLEDVMNNITEENEQLKKRNQRQAKHLAELYELIAKKDWRALTKIIDEFIKRSW